MPNKHYHDTIRALPCWSGAIEIEVLAGGMTNRNFRVHAPAGQSFVVRLGRDIPEHGVMRFNELAAARAAHAAGIAPEVVYGAPGILVCRFVEGETLSPERVRERPMLQRIAALLRRCHEDTVQHFQGPALMFWVFQVIRSYLGLLRVRDTTPLALDLASLAARNRQLEQALGPVNIAFGHNDLLAANLIDDGRQLWLIDWDYAGFNTPLFDLANLATNNGLSVELATALLESYWGGAVTAQTQRGFEALQCASLLRETLWAAVSSLTSTIAFDYPQYGADYLHRFEQRWQEFEGNYGRFC